MRLPLACILGVIAAGSLSGCGITQLHNFLTEPRDYPARHDGAASPGTATTSAGTKFTGRASGAIAARVVIKNGYPKTTIKNARLAGDYRATPAAAQQDLGPLASGTWHANFNIVRNRATGRYTIKGLILATFDDTSAGRSCLRLKAAGKRAQNRWPKKPPRAKLTVLGGQGGARTLAGTARARVRLKRDLSVGLRGTVDAKRGAERGFPRPCRKLAKKFGLAPL